MSYRLLAAVSFKNDAEVLGKCLKRLSEFADGIVCLDDGSTDDSVKIAESFPKVIELLANPPDREWNCRRDMFAKYQLIEKIQPEWLMSLDPDDLVDARFAQRHEQLLQVPDVQQYTFAEVTLWGDTQHYRVDKPEWYARPICFTPQLIRWSTQVKIRVGGHRWKTKLLKSLSRRWPVGVLKKLTRPRWLKTTSNKMLSPWRELFYPSDYMGYTNCQFIGPPGKTINLDLKKIHYHYVDMQYAIKKHVNYALQAAIRQHRTADEVPEIVDWATQKLSTEGLRLESVKSEWGVL